MRLHGVVAILFACSPLPLAAAEITVTSIADTTPAPAGECTLREAIEAINAGVSSVECLNASEDPFGVDDEIRFAAELAGQTIVLSGEQLPLINVPLKITGPVESDPAGMTIDGDGQARILDIAGAVASEFEVELSYLTLTGGRTTRIDERGGAVRVENAGLTLNYVTVTGNSTEGVYVPDGPLGISAGGGISTQFGDVTIHDSTITGNFTEGMYLAFGGGLSVNRGNVEIARSLISGNFTAGPNAFGGGLIIENADLSLIDSTIHGNWTTGENALGGGMLVGGSPSRNYTAILVNSTIADNWTEGEHAHGGGLGAGQVDVFLTNSTVSGNSTSGKNAGGGGLVAGFSQLTLTHSTIAFNTAAGGVDGVFLEDTGDTLSLENSLIVQADAAQTACSQMAVSVVASLATDDSCTGAATDLQDIALAALAGNGGATHTHALNAGSVAINAADDDYCTDHDQRGVSRPQGEGCDIGAYEVEQNQSGTLFRDRFETPLPD